MAQVSYGTITITDTNDIERIYMEYAQSSSNSTAPTTGWSEDIPAWEQGKYIWQRTVVKKEGVALSSDSYGEPVCLTGSTGSAGATGRGVSSIVTTYCNYGTGTPAASYSGWSTTVPIYDSTKPNYWIKTVITYTTGTPTTDTKIYQDNGITSATATAASAKTQAAAAEGKADTAVSTANTANTNASNALNIATGINQHFWTIATDYATGVPAGSYITDTAIDTFKSNKTGGNLLTRSDGIWIRNGVNTLTSLTGTALTFYNPSTNTAQLIIGANGTLQSGNYSYTSGQIFSVSGTKIDLTDGTIYSPYFRILTSTLGDNEPGAYIRGDVVARTGRFGSSTDNYWLIDTYYDTEEQEYYSSLRGIGKSFIQLGSTNTWTLGTNRINSSWRYISTEASGVTNPFLLRYKRFGTTSSDGYYDYGMNLPTILNTSDQNAKRIADKFLYIRTADYVTDSGLANLDLDSSWTYPFYVDSQGNVRAKAFYVGNSTTAIGGGTGTIAEKLTQGYGSESQPIYVQPDGTPKEISYTIQTSVPAGALFTDTWKPLTTSQAGYVPVKAPNSTSQFLRGDATWAAVTKSNVGLGNVENVALSTWAGSSSLTTTKVGTLAEAATRGVDTSISAASTSTNLPTSTAVANLIKQYLPLTGGNVTGAVSFGSSVSADELTVGDLVVNGAASFTNNLQANTINGVEVGSNPKFTDTVTTVTVTGNGNAVTSASASNGAVTLTKGTTFPTGSGTNGYLTKWTGTNTIGDGPALGSDTTKFLNNKGEWAVPTGTYTYTLPLAANGTRGGVQIGFTTNNTNRNYAVQLSSEKMYVNVPWENTTYESKAAASEGTDVSLVTTGEKYTWNQKTSNTGTVTSIATNSPITGGTITSSGTIGHATSGVGNAVTTVGLYKFKYDTYGHVTGVATIAKADITGLGIPAQDTTYSNASTTTAGLMSAADKKKLDDIQVDSSGQAVAANVAGRWGIDVTFSNTNVAQVGHANTAVTASNTQASTVSSATTKTALSFGSIVKLPYVSYDTYGHVTGKSEVYFQLPAAPSSTTSATNATNDSDGNPINTTYIKKSIGTAAGDIIYWSAANTPVRLAKGSNGQVLKLANGVPTWGTDNNDNTTYSLSGSLSSHKFTTTLTPSSGSATTSAFTLAAGSNISLTDSGTTITIAATDTNTATAVDNILDGSNSGTAITYAPYTARADKLMFYTGTTAPNGTTRLNLNGYLYATKLYSNGSEVLTSHQDISGKIDTAGTGLSKSGTTLNHSNSVTAQTTQAVYPIKIDAQGHISGYGSAQTILSLGTGSSNAYRGDYGNTAYTHATDSGRLTTAKSSSFYKFSVTAHGHVGSVTAVAASDITGLLSFGTAYNASSNKIATISDVTSAVNGATDKYVTLDTDQTLVANGTKKYLGLQTYGSNGVAFGVTSSSSITQKVVTKYDSTLDALVFQFS